MGFSDETYAAAKKYTDNTVAGAGGLAGVPCQIQSITPITGGNRVTFLWIDNNGDEHTSTMNVMNGVDGEDGEDGKGIQSVSVNENNHLIITYSDGTTTDAGQIEIHSAVDSVNGQTGTVSLDAEDVGALPDDTPIPSKTSDLTNNSGFITKVVNDLVNYYLKSETYSKTEVDDIVTAIKNSRFEVVATLPTTDIKTNVIYLVPKDPVQTSNVKDEYINLDGTTSGWEKIGDTEIDLSGYVTTQALNTALAAYTTTADLTTLLAAKQDTLTFDNVPTENSNNPVKSNGLYVANRNIYEVMGEMGAKNINKTVYVSRTTQVGIEWTVNEDGTVTANGTASGDTVNGGVATDGFIAPFTAQVILTGGISTLAHIYPYDQTTSSRPYTDSSKTELQTADATGNNEVPFYMEEGHVYNLGLRIKNTAILDNAVFKPMLRLASDPDNTYVPYAPTNAKLNKEKMSYADNGVLGAKNLLPTPYYSTKGGTTTSGTLTVTENADGSVTIDGTASGRSYIDLARNDKFLKAGTYILSGGLTSKQYVYINCLNNGTYVRTLVSSTISEVKFVLDYNGYDAITVGISIASGEVLSNTTFYPMLRLASDPNNTYVPYAKTNKQLTDDAEALTNQANDIVNVLGAKNVLPFPYYEGSGTYNGVTITDNGDGSITLDGTCTGMSFFVFYGGRYSLAPTTFVKKNEDYIATLEVVSGSMAINSGTSKFVFRNYITNATSPFVDIFYEDNVIDTRSVKFTYEPTASYDTSLVWYEFNVGTTFNNWRIRPMIRLASITDSTYEPYAMTNQQMTPYVQAISNPNLLDNPWFTINQRGQSSYTIGTGNTTTLDRWTAFKGANGSMSVEVNNGAKITVSSDASDNAFRERIGIDEFNFLVGKTVTLSILMDGTVYSVTGKVLERAASWQTSFKRILDNGLIIELAISPSSSTTYAAEIDFRAPKDGNSYTIRAAKLELGTVSTLAMDMAPNYQQELAKCQRYFQRISQAGSSDTLCMATYRNDYTLRTVLPLTVPMRAAPSVTVNGTVSDYTNSGLTMTKISQPVTNGGAVGISFNISKSGVTWNNGVSKCITSDSTDFYIDLSADL